MLFTNNPKTGETTMLMRSHEFRELMIGTANFQDASDELSFLRGLGVDEIATILSNEGVFRKTLPEDISVEALSKIVIESRPPEVSIVPTTNPNADPNHISQWAAPEYANNVILLHSQ